MIPLIAVGAVVLLVVLQSQHRSLTTRSGSAVPQNVPARAVLNQPQQAVLGGSVIDMAGEQGLSVGSQLATNAAKNVGSSLATAIPVIGGVVSAIAASLLAAHEQRKAQATSENDAVDRFIPQWDQALTQIVNNYNSGALTSNQAITLLDSLWPQFWAEVTPHIQSGRNGCNGGAGIDYSVAHPPTGSTAQHCSGSWGAACCIGAEVIGSTLGRLQRTIMQVDQSGGSQIVTVSPVVRSKYSAFSRPAYNLTVARPA